MYKNSSVILLITLTSSLFLFNGCVPSPGKCFQNASRDGYYCHQGYNFGKNRSAEYKLGVRHGCRTANGFFMKNYTLAKQVPAYVQGWDRGRGTCKLHIPKEAAPDTMRTQYQQSIDEQKYYRR